MQSSDTHHCFELGIARGSNIPLLVWKSGVVLQNVGSEVDSGEFHLVEMSIDQLNARSGASNIVRRTPEAELELAIVGDVRVCDSSDGHKGLRRVLDCHILR